jgi:Glutamate synthase central domain
MGISTLQSYKGAQVFEAVGLADDIVDRCFTGTTSRLQGTGMSSLYQDIAHMHSKAYPLHSNATPLIDNLGMYHYRDGGEAHLNNPETMVYLQVCIDDATTFSMRNCLGICSLAELSAVVCMCVCVHLLYHRFACVEYLCRSVLLRELSWWQHLCSVTATGVAGHLCDEHYLCSLIAQSVFSRVLSLSSATYVLYYTSCCRLFAHATTIAYNSMHC